MSDPKINTQEKSWSVTADTEEEALDFVNGLNNSLSHPELDTPDKILEWIAAQEAETEEEDEEGED